MDCHRDRGSGCSRLEYGKALLEEVAINPTTELPELTQDWEIDSWRAQTEPCALIQTCLCVQESPAEVWVGGLLQDWGHGL